MIEIGKTYQTRHGWQARIHATDLGGGYPVAASVRDPNGRWLTMRYTEDGVYCIGLTGDFNLIEVKQPITITRWVNVYEYDAEINDYRIEIYLTEDIAKRFCGGNAIMTVPVIIIGCKGDGL